MITSQQYRERLKRLKSNVFIDGELVDRGDSRMQGEINTLAITYDMAEDPSLEGITTATSHLTGEKINRFCHIHQNSEDMLARQKMTRHYCTHTWGCILRCMGCDALNALSVVTHEADQKYGTEYNARFLKYLKWFQENDLVAAAAQTDVKGDRSKRPHQQADPDLYLHVVSRGEDGIVVRGAKCSVTMVSHADEILVMPTRAFVEGEEDYAVSFALPADHEGVSLITRAASPRARQQLKAPIAELGSTDSVVVFDDVFVPWDRVFLCGEKELGGRLAVLFALYHRHSYTGCKPAVSDIIMGATALVAEYNGVERADHIRHKLADMIGVAELVYSTGIAGAVMGQKSSSGTYIPDVVYVNVGRRHAGENVYHESDILADISGGMSATLPPEGDFFNEKTGPYLEKYMMRNPNIPAEYQHRCFRFISDIICSSFGAVWQIAGIHGGGSPIMETIAILGNYDLEAKKDVARYLAGIPKKKS
ncbi:MAG: 4-hydroxyphenylacetate 3-hydroxylase N-terminal domain-containing protein [Dehalococcoidia bacterium]|nr:4-hydroxyphenylacetate 3-hydroxylase N-terminal domain-containing protein [Dehalococcoidia bacterium]MDP7240189.1 4-hydroxyphenylacetate 3-hydroxylase N-terminal domain-containing protein [Dehalococcoidia bacterium]